MEKLFELQNILLKQFVTRKFYPRALFNSFTFDNAICGLVGPRGVGKTTYLLKYALEHGATEQKALYVSADNIYFLETSLLDLVDKLFKETAVRLLLVDEIHKYSGWQQQLKNIRDTYLDFKIIFTGSSQIDLIHGKFDLSRRVTLYQVHGFSFREYLEVVAEQKIPVCTFDEIITNHVSIANELSQLEIIQHFHTYLRSGYYPFYREFTVESEKFQAIENIIQKIIYEDIGTFHSFKTQTLSLIEKLYKFVLNSAPGEVSINKLANALGKDYTNISDYLSYLQQAGLIRFLDSEKAGKAGLRHPTKLYPENSNLMYAAYLPISDEVMRGKVRETFIINHLQNAKVPVFYSEKGDFKIRNCIVEVGGRNKTDEQIKGLKNAYLLKDGIFTGMGKTIPLHLFGFLY